MAEERETREGGSSRTQNKELGDSEGAEVAASATQKTSASQARQSYTRGLTSTAEFVC